MKINQYLVTVHWGAGIHYITSSPETLKECCEEVKLQQANADRTKKMYKTGPKPLARGWTLALEGKDIGFGVEGLEKILKQVEEKDEPK